MNKADKKTRLPLIVDKYKWKRTGFYGMLCEAYREQRDADWEVLKSLDKRVVELGDQVIQAGIHAADMLLKNDALRDEIAELCEALQRKDEQYKPLVDAVTIKPREDHAVCRYCGGFSSAQECTPCLLKVSEMPGLMGYLLVIQDALRQLKED